MKQLMKRFATLALAIIFAASFVPTQGVAQALEASASDAAQATSETSLNAESSDATGLTAQSSPMEAQASDVGSLTVGANTSSYASASALSSALSSSKNEGKTIVINMYQDWTGTSLVIPKNAKATLNMNGHKLDRDLNSKKRNGYVIYMEPGSSLTVNGGDEAISHSVGVFASTDPDKGRTATRTFTGGVICGGYNSNGGGGFYINANCKLTMNKVTLAGCRAEQNWGSDGYGGGMYICGGNNTLTMNDSTITGCYAYNDGGGIYESNKDLFALYATNSHIDSNYARTDGGGLAPSGERLTFSGDGKSTISNNECGSDGGGMYVWHHTVSISGFCMEGNKAGSLGGALYTLETEYELTSLVVRNNSAAQGGGIYLNKGKKSTISGCEVTGNQARQSGGGILVNKDTTSFAVSGKCIVKDNKNGSGGSDNLFLKSGTRVNLSVTSGSDVHVLYEGLSADSQMITEGKVGDTIKSPNCIQFLTSDNSGYHFTFNAAVNQRKIYLVKDGKDSTATGDPYKKQVNQETVSAEEAKGATTGQTMTGADNNTYSILRGYFTHPDANSSTRDTAARFYYADGLFAGDPKTYNEHLATASYALAMSGFYLNAGGTQDYSNKHASARQFMADIGVATGDIYVNDFNTQKPTTETIGVVIGSKKLAYSDGSQTDYTLVVVSVRGAGYEAEWASNVTIGESGEAAGFASAADTVTKEIESYLASHNITDTSKVKFWVAGYSRAGATANLTSKRLVEKYTTAQVFGYCCEAPQGGVDSAEQLSDKSAYYCIHNLINATDIVPLVAPTCMGFKRYGVDHYIPGTTASATPTPTTTGSNGTTRTTYADNAPLYTKTSDYNTKRDNEMLAQLAAIDSTIVFDDYFHLAQMDYYNQVFVEKGGYTVIAEEFIGDFINAFAHWSGIEERANYNSKAQPIFRSLMAMVFGMSKEDADNFIARASTTMKRFSLLTPFSETVSKYELYRKVIKTWYERSDSEKQHYRNAIYDKLAETGALEYLSTKQVNEFKRNWPDLANILFSFVSYDFQQKGAANWTNGSGTPMSIFNYMYSDYKDDLTGALAVGTLGYNASRLLASHVPEINLAWARSYDSWYTNEKTEYTIAAPASVSAPTASVDNAALAAGSSSTYYVSKRLTFDVGSNTGAAVYYTLKNTSTGVTTATNHIYQGPITLPKTQNDATYEITAYAQWHGVKSATATWTVMIANPSHKITVNSLAADGNALTYTSYADDGKTTSLFTQIPANKTFTEWSVVDETGKDVSDIIFTGGYADKKYARTARVSLPYGGNDGLSTNYALTFTANYKDMVNALTVALAQPVTGELLATTATVSWGSGDPASSVTAPVSWTYKVGSGGSAQVVSDSGNAEAGVVYTATVRFSAKDKAAFASTLEATLAGDSGTITSTKVDGDVVTITIDYPATAGEEKAPVNPHTVTVTCLDAMLNANIANETEEFRVCEGDTVTIFAPDIDGYEFDGWSAQGDWTKTGYTEVKVDNEVIGLQFAMPAENRSIELKYHPLIQAVNIANVAAPQAGEDMATGENVTVEYVTAQDVKYTVSSGYFDFGWVPDPSKGWGVADYDTAYTAIVSLKPDADKKINVVTSGNAAKQFSIGDFVYADDLAVKLNGNAAAFDELDHAAWYTFPATDAYSTSITSVTQPDEIIGVAHGATADDILALLPATASVAVDDGDAYDLPITWDELTVATHDPLDEAVWTATGTLAAPLPAGIDNNDNVSLAITQTVYVDAAPFAPAPTCSEEPGVRTTFFTATLSTPLEGATIYYTTDGSDPTDTNNTNRKKYEEGTPISISRADATRYTEEDFDSYLAFICAYATAEGYQDSEAVTFTYLFTDEIEPPDGASLIYSGEEQVGVWGDGSYELTALEGDGLRIDEDGDAVATKAGTYKVKASLIDPDFTSWTLDEKSSDELTGASDGNLLTAASDGYLLAAASSDDGLKTDADQIIEFTIAKGSLADAQVVVEPTSAVYTGSPIEPKVTVFLDGVEVSSSDYEVEYQNNTEVGTAKVIVKATGNYQDDPEPASFTIVAKQSDGDDDDDDGSDDTNQTDNSGTSSDSSGDTGSSSKTSTNTSKSTTRTTVAAKTGLPSTGDDAADAVLYLGALALAAGAIALFIRRRHCS